MKRLFTTLFLVLSLFGRLAAQTINEQQIISEISKSTSSIKTMQCDFVQTKSLKMLGDKMVSKGKMYCQQPSKLRWEYTTPYTYTFVLNDNNVMLKSGSRSDVIDINQNKMFKEIARIMMNSVLGKLLTEKKDFSVTVKQNGKQYVATLTPLRKDLKQMFTHILLHYDIKEKMVKTVVLKEKNGDSTTIELTNIKKNSPINASVFEIK
ncbi:MAG: outer membrane lipoprotein carrier protein LolA [Paludibacteraceae bacterium]|nr:outer membrane lipoprotein carrier protein LolA [Paludibacteraceae bacterium]